MKKIFLTSIVVLALLLVPNVVKAEVTYEISPNGATWTEVDSLEDALSTNPSSPLVRIKGAATDQCVISGDLGDNAIQKSIIVDTVICDLNTELKMASSAAVGTLNGGKVRVSGNGVFIIEGTNGFSVGNLATHQLQNSTNGKVLISAINASGETISDLATLLTGGASTFVETEGNVFINKPFGLFVNDTFNIKAGSTVTIKGTDGVLDIKGTISSVDHAAIVNIAATGKLIVDTGAELLNGHLINNAGIIENKGSIENQTYGGESRTVQDQGTFVITGKIDNYGTITFSEGGLLTGSTGNITNYEGGRLFIKSGVSVPSTLKITNELASRVINQSGNEVSVTDAVLGSTINLEGDKILTGLVDDADNPKVIVTASYEVIGTLGVTEVTEGESYNSLFSVKTKNQEVLGTYDIVLNNTTLEGDIHVSFFVGLDRVGDTITVLHLPAGKTTPDTYTAVVNSEGIINITVPSLSPFMLLAATSANPNTLDNILYYGLAFVISAIGIGIMVYYKKRTN